MMTAGFQIFGDHGLLQIDESLVNFGLTARGTATLPAPVPNTWQTTTITVTGISPIICLRALSNHVFVWYTTRSGNQFTFTIRGQGPGETFEWFVFDRMPSAGPGGFGLEVRDAAGNTTFNSNVPPMIIAAIGQLPTDAWSLQTVTIDTGVARKYAHFNAESIYTEYAWDTGGVEWSYVIWHGVKITSTGLETALLFKDAVDQYLVDNPAGGQIILVDVTNIY